MPRLFFYSILWSPVSYQRYIYLTFLAGAITIALTVRSASVATLAALGRPDNMVGGMVPISVVIAGGVGLMAFFTALRNRDAVIFTNEVIVELVKVKWPDREETVNSTLIVLVATFILAGALAFFDWGWARITNTFLYSA